MCHTDCRGRVQGRPSLTGLRGVRAHRSTLSRTVALGRWSVEGPSRPSLGVEQCWRPRGSQRAVQSVAEVTR